MLTRIEIVDEALEQAELDQGFRNKGRRWLNIAIERLSKRYNYRSLRVTQDVAFVSGLAEYDLPADFNRVDTVFFVDQSGNQGSPISVRESYEADPFKLSSSSGFPQVVWVDTARKKIVFNSGPAEASGQKFRLNYFKKPIQYSIDDTDDDVQVDFEDQWTLLEEVKALALEWSNHERYPMKRSEANQAQREYQRNMFQSDSNSRVPLNNEVFRPTNRRGRR